MRFRRRFSLLALAVTCAFAGTDASGPPQRQSSGVPGDADLGRLAEFLGWAHPLGDCGPPSGLRIAARWPGGLTARYEIVCGAAKRLLEGVFQIREKESVWQVSSGFEAEADRIAPALEALKAASASPLDLVPQPQPTGEIVPEYPEEAGRARLIGDAHVGLLVQISPEGVPLRTRPLRGPDPDLGMRHAAIDAVMRARFAPARLADHPVTYFAPIELTFAGLPAESRNWEHRALFHVEAIVSSDGDSVDEALRRLQEGEPFETVARDPSSAAPATPSEALVRGGDWGFVSAAALPAAVRKALHEARVGAYAGPVVAEGLHYLMLKKGEVYYAIRPREDTGELTYQILHQRNPPDAESLRHAVESDIADFLVESRRQAYVNEAARLMGIHQTQTEIGRLVIRTDVLDEDEVRMLGQLIEAAVRAHERFWSPLVPLRPVNQQILVYAWGHQADHDRLHTLWQAGRGRVGPARTVAPGAARAGGEPWGYAGEYVPASRILSVPCERMGGHLPVPVVVHEAIHMLDYERIYRQDTPASQWFEEGLATYFGFSQMSGRLNIEPGEIRRSRPIVTGQVRLQFDARVPLRDYMKRIQDGGAIPLRALLGAKAGEPIWSGDRAVLAYSASWTLVHFLLHGGRGRYRAAFDEYARLEARGQGGIEPFTRLFGPDLGALEEAWHSYEENL